MISHPSETKDHRFHRAGRPTQTYTDDSFKKKGGDEWKNPPVFDCVWFAAVTCQGEVMTKSEASATCRVVARGVA